MLDKKRLAIGVGAVFLASVLLTFVAVLEYNFWWDYTSPIKENGNLVEIVAAIKDQEVTAYDTLKTKLEYVYNNVLYTHETYLVPNKNANITIYVDQTDPTHIEFRKPFSDAIVVTSAISLIAVAGLLCFVVWPIYRNIFSEEKHSSEIKW